VGNRLPAVAAVLLLGLLVAGTPGSSIDGVAGWE
jgi:hypothetical protein